VNLIHVASPLCHLAGKGHTPVHNLTLLSPCADTTVGLRLACFREPLELGKTCRVSPWLNEKEAQTVAENRAGAA
jgi:hypothetical protein